MKEAIEQLILAIVDDKEAVEISESQERNSIFLKVKVAESDMGRIIGREGRTIKAIRSILFALGQKNGKRYILDIIE